MLHPSPPHPIPLYPKVAAMPQNIAYIKNSAPISTQPTPLLSKGGGCAPSHSSLFINGRFKGCR